MVIEGDDFTIMSEEEEYWDEIINNADEVIKQFEKNLKLQRAIMEMAIEHKKLAEIKAKESEDEDEQLCGRKERTTGREN